MCLCVCVCVCVCVCDCLYVYQFLCVIIYYSVSVCLWCFIRVCMHKHTHIHTHVHTHTHTTHTHLLCHSSTGALCNYRPLSMHADVRMNDIFWWRQLIPPPVWLQSREAPYQHLISLSCPARICTPRTCLTSAALLCSAPPSLLAQTQPRRPWDAGDNRQLTAALK